MLVKEMLKKIIPLSTRQQMRRMEYYVLQYWYRLSPIQNNKVVLINFSGHGFGCNPKYIALELHREFPDCELVWLIRDISEDMPTYIRKVQWTACNVIKEVSSAKVVVANSTGGSIINNKRKGQYWIQTWHASFSPKLLEFAAAKTLPRIYINDIARLIPQFDLFLSNSKMQTQEYRDAFHYQGEVLECGYPRNDVLVNHTEQQRDAIQSKLSIPQNCQVMFYMPTFRGDGDMSPYQLDAERLKKTLEEKFDTRWIVAVRLHPNISDHKAPIQFGKDILDFTKYPDPQELMLAADALITDYSTTMFDFAIMQKPIILFATDIQKYNDEIRGLKPMYRDLPFPLAESNDQLMTIIKNMDWQDYLDKLNAYMSVYGNFDKGTAAETVCQRIMQYMKN